MEKTVMVLRVEHMEIEVNDVRTNTKKKIDKANLLVTDGTDRFICEAFDSVAKEVKADNLTGKLCGLSCQMNVREWQKDGRQGETTQIRVLSCKSLFEEMDKFLNKDKDNGNG